MKNDTNLWDETLRQRLLEAEQDSDYPVWNEHRVWQKTQLQLIENQPIAPLHVVRQRKYYWYAIAVGLLLCLIQKDFGNLEIQKLPAKEVKNSTAESAIIGNLKFKNSMKEKLAGSDFRNSSSNNSIKEHLTSRAFENLENENSASNLVSNSASKCFENPTLETTTTTTLQRIAFVPSLPPRYSFVQQTNSDSNIVFCPILKGNCTVLNLPLLREEKPIARFFRQLKRFNTDGTLPTNVSNLPVVVQRINGE